jgi:rubrerythrin
MTAVRSKTEANLQVALAGEADANRRYLAYGIQALNEGRPEIAQLYNVITFQLGNYQFVAVKARMRESQSASRLVAAINTVQDELKVAFRDVHWVFFEPDEKD